MVSLSPGNRILAELRQRKALRLSSCNLLALGPYEDLAAAIQRRLPEGGLTANPSEQVATKMDSMDYFKTAPEHEVKIATWRIEGVPHEEIARRLQMSPSVYKAVSNQMLAKWAKHRGTKVGSLEVPSQQSRGVARRERFGGAG